MIAHGAKAGSMTPPPILDGTTDLTFQEDTVYQKSPILGDFVSILFSFLYNSINLALKS